MSRTLMEGERELAETRRHWSVVAPTVAAILVAGLVLLVAVLLVPSHIGSFDVGTIRAAIAVIVVVVALVLAAMPYLRWRYTRYVLTNCRLLIEQGVLSRDVESIALDRVQNTTIHRPLGDRVIGAGDIEIESAGRDGTERLERVPRVERFYATLLQAIGEAMEQPPSGRAPSGV